MESALAALCVFRSSKLLYHHHQFPLARFFPKFPKSHCGEGYHECQNWDTTEENQLKEMRRQGMSFADIGKALNRTELSVAGKWLDLVPLPEELSLPL